MLPTDEKLISVIMLSVKFILRCRCSVELKCSDSNAHIAKKNAQIKILKSKLKLRSKLSAKKKLKLRCSAIEKMQTG